MATKRGRWIHQLQALRDRLKGNQHCTRCGALPNQRGILIVEPAALNALQRDHAGNLVERVHCPACLVVPAVLLPANGR